MIERLIKRIRERGEYNQAFLRGSELGSEKMEELDRTHEEAFSLAKTPEKREAIRRRHSRLRIQAITDGYVEAFGKTSNPQGYLEKLASEYEESARELGRDSLRTSDTQIAEAGQLAAQTAAFLRERIKRLKK